MVIVEEAEEVIDQDAMKTTEVATITLAGKMILILIKIRMTNLKVILI